MENLSFLFIAIGAILQLFRRSCSAGLRVGILELLAILTVVAVALASWLDIFVGPLGDARRYHSTINACAGSMPPCGTKLHEMLWSIFSSVLGPVWALVYGYTVATALSLIARTRVLSVHKPILAILFIYSAYQIGNGMAEGTFVLLLLIGVVALHSKHFISGALGLFSAFFAHLGNAPFVLYLLRFPRSWPLLALILGLLLVLIAFLGVVELNDIYSIVNKAGALASREATFAAVETKANVSVQGADTSYADILFNMGFPYAPKSLIYSVLLFLAPILAGGDAITFVLGAISTVMTISTIWLARKHKTLLLIFALSVIVFGLASFTPGIGLRHKVPLFLFMLMVQHPDSLRDLLLKNGGYMRRF
ncbi:hypothetical protein SAMN05216571_103317 [Onishia taeanensis]|uniref:Uncharacterized protein n=1 Tax=Onishia taeanensis TaxID=284577 RepID=A0A1G7QL26_9GAMM|nr:hypothetical protein [Halomonas taeanensis]SDF99185.1 hypothetical protein SAMN05216571_103317 [Halomonas taeanensis]